MLPQTDAQFLRQVAYHDAHDLDIRNDILEQYRTHNRLSWYEWLLEQFSWPENSTILDLGCGPADLWVKNRRRLSSGWQIYLSDFSAGMIYEARKRLHSGSHNQSERATFHFAILDSTRLPFLSGFSDAILALGLLDHMRDPEQALREIQRVLKPGGTFYASAGGRNHLQEIENLVSPFLPAANFGGDPQRFGLDNGAKLLSPYFAALDLHSYHDELIFSEAEPLIAFVLSEAEVRAQLTGDDRIAWQRFIEQRLKQEGEIRVTTEKGLFSGQSKV